MAIKTLQNLLEDIGAYVDQSLTLPTGDELTSRVNYVNRALEEWGNSFQWKQLRFSSTVTSVTVGNPSLALPSTFKKLMSPLVDESKPVDKTRNYVEIRPEERLQKGAADKYIYILGDAVRGNSIHVNPSQASGVTYSFDYQAFPSSMATLTDICVNPYPEFISSRAIGYVLEARSDPRFPQVKADADTMLQRQIEEEVTPSGGEDNKVPTWPEKTGFRIGE